jgi:lipopolysaccharide/colanic/teichoic acid biosynthesis glycosyltransferase
LREGGTAGDLAPSQFEVSANDARLDGVGTSAVASADPFAELLPAAHFSGRAAKRIFDLVIAGVLLLVAVPLLLVVALLVKVDSAGPMLYRSRRIGRHGESFQMFKFRTMIDGADRQREALRVLSEAPEGLFKVTRDPRLTRIGRLLRSTSLDELPQLIHVLSGRMSLVGPRPLVSEESELIPASNPRFLARPGITGPWQLAGSWRVPIPEMVQLDTDYLDNWSIWTDLKMLFRTMGYAVRRVGV